MENNFIAFIESAQGSEFYSIGSNLNASDKFKSDKNNYLNTYTQSQKEYISEDLKVLLDTISKFADNRIQAILSIEKQLTENLQSKTLFEQIVTVKNEIGALEQQLIAQNKRIQNNNIELKNYREQQAVFNAIKEEARIYSSHFHILLSKEVQQAFGPIKLIVEEVLEKYLKHDDRNVDLEIKMREDEVDDGDWRGFIGNNHSLYSSKG